MPSYDGRVSGSVVCPLCRGMASSEAEMSYPLEGGSLPSSEAEVIGPLKGGSLPSSEAEMRGAVEGPDGSPRARRRSSRGPDRV